MTKRNTRVKPLIQTTYCRLANACRFMSTSHTLRGQAIVLVGALLAPLASGLGPGVSSDSRDPPNVLAAAVPFSKHFDGVIQFGEEFSFLHDDVVFECPQLAKGFASLQLNYDDASIDVPGSTLHQVNLRVEVRETGRLLAENLLPGPYKAVRFHYDACTEGLRAVITGVNVAPAGDRFHLFLPCLGVHTFIGFEEICAGTA